MNVRLLSRATDTLKLATTWFTFSTKRSWSCRPPSQPPSWSLPRDCCLALSGIRMRPRLERSTRRAPVARDRRQLFDRRRPPFCTSLIDDSPARWLPSRDIPSKRRWRSDNCGNLHKTTINYTLLRLINYHARDGVGPHGPTPRQSFVGPSGPTLAIFVWLASDTLVGTLSSLIDTLDFY